MTHSDEHIQQQIESYLNQEMTDLERSRFEKQIHDDPDLHEEVQMQEAAMEALRRERMLILKSGLSQVPISLWSTGLIEAAKVAAITFGIGLASVGGYYAFDSYHQSKSQSETELAPKVSEIPNSESENLEISQEQDSQTVFNSSPENSEVPQQKEITKSNKESLSRKEEVSSKPEKSTVVLNSNEELSNEPIEPSPKAIQTLSSKDVANPVDGISNKTSLESIHPEVVFKRDNKNIFHYQFSDGKLILYADFTDKLYEVIELNQNGIKQVFFCYDNTFYPLNSNQFEIAPLKEVQDKNLVQILKAYQKRRN